MDRPSHKAVPAAPPNMWDQLEQTVAETFERPKNSFTRKEFETKFGLPTRTANHRLRKLVDLGKIRMIRGESLTNTYYQYIEKTKRKNG